MSEETKSAVLSATRSRVTIKDLADDLGMSVSTISRAFQENSRIADRSRQIVLTRAAELGYKANPFARTLVGKKTKIVGVLVSRISSPFYGEMLNLIAKELRADNMSLMLIAGEHVQEIRDGLNVLMAYDPVAVLVMSSYASAETLAGSPIAHDRLVYFNRFPADRSSLALAYDNRGAGAKMANYLIGLGHRRFCYVSSGLESSTDEERGQGFAAEIMGRDLPAPAVIITTGFTYEAGMAAAAQVAARIDEIDAVFCAADMMALGLMDGMRYTYAVDVPARLSIAGCDDIAMAGWPSHSLTTVRMPRRAMVREIVRLIQSIAADRRPSSALLRVGAADIVVRRSAGPNMRG
ncbi:LacI family DNA-binding transcriptional regulator [Marinivivus vitaminiproducens]|uniref:LacI family DNA-binding transcriptional regulator n=1 Tax=Marinivivus vitaminiproducens TaxID=3035935 RepID=UPI002798EDA7|nr:LacI family DNA-binding transcriptional regulator [Geminicoccaceae bacterium SCSIO 64248]